MAPKIVYQNPQQDSGGVYNREVVFNLEQYGLVQMIFLIFEATINPVATPGAGPVSLPAPVSPYLIQDVSLESFGNPISHVTTSYTLGRFDELDKDLYDQVNNGCNFPQSFNAVQTQTASLPLYFWCIDGQKLDTFKYRNLTIRVRTKGSPESVGLTNGTLDSLGIKMKVFYDQQKVPVSVELKNPYNVYRTITEISNVAAGTNTFITKLNVPYKICNLFFMLRKTENAEAKVGIRSIRLSTPTHVIGTFDDITNYYLGEKNSANSGNTFAIQLSSRYSSREEHMNFNGQENPTIAEITFVSADTDSLSLYSAFEYYSNIVESDGMLLEDNTRSFVRG